MAAHERPDFSQQGYQDVKPRINVFCDNEIRKDSQLQLTDQQARDLIRKAEMHSVQSSYAQSPIIHSSSAETHGQDLRASRQQAYNLSTMMHTTVKDEFSDLQSPSDSSLDRHVEDSPPNSSQSATTSDMYSSLDPINKAIEAQSENYKRLSQSDKAHICQTCFKTFRNKPQLSQHELVHNNVRKHTCSYCEKSFKQLSHLNQHIRVHTGNAILLQSFSVCFIEITEICLSICPYLL